MDAELGRISDGYQGTQQYAKPIVLDLDGDGFELRGPQDVNVQWDIDGIDAARERIGWVGRDDGLLVIDGDGDGIHNAREFIFTLLHPEAQTDLAALAYFDKNADYKLTSADPIFQHLRVWRDLDQDGVSDAGEIKGLAHYGINRIDLGYTVNTLQVDLFSGNTVFGVGSTNTVRFADVAFSVMGRSTSALPTAPVNDTYIGTNGADMMTDLPGNDTLFGGSGNDTLVNGAGNDKLSGGGGNDWYVWGTLSASTDTILDFSTIGDHLDLRAVTSSIGDVTLTRMDSNTWRVRVDDQTILIETSASLTVGSKATDDIIVAATTGSGTAGDDNMVGNAAANSFNGGAGDDTIRGGGGNDSLLGASGDDTLQGQDADDSLGGGEGNDTLIGAGGDDWADGGTGFDGVYGGDGDDVLYGGDDSDTIVGEAGGDELRGGGGNDNLDGGADGDLLLGHDGNDTLAGGLGNDIMTGAAGADRFVVNRNEGVDRITDFVTGQDELDLRDCGFTSVSQVRALAVIVTGGIRIDLPGTGTLTVLGLDAPSDLVSGDLLL